jgi:spore germination protein GerM
MITKHPVLYTVLAVIALSAVCMALFTMSSKSSAEDQFNQNVQTSDIQNSNKSVVHLYFSDKNNSFLTAEERALLHSDNPAEFGKIIIEALIDGPRKGLMRTIPTGTTLKALYVTRDGTAYVDISNTIKNSHPGGIRSELFTIFSIVNSLILNIPKLDAVKILIGGNESMTLAGHIDLRFPFKANMLLIR